MNVIRYTVKKIFEIISENRDENEFYNKPAFHKTSFDYFIKLITHFSPNEKEIIISDCREQYLNDINIGDQEVNVDGLIIFNSMAHEEDYIIFRINSIDQTEKFILGLDGITNMFTEDIVVLENGKRKKYCIKDKKGDLIKVKDFIEKDFHNIDDEYFLQWI